MLLKKSHFFGLALLSTFLLSSLAPAAVAGNWWAGPERRGSCYIPNRQTSYRCRFGRYRRVSGARQIGGFYLNPTNNLGYTGPVVLEYRTNGGDWQQRTLTMNATSGNYINFGYGVTSFDYRFPRPQSSLLGDGGGTIYFRMNYDLDG